MKNIILIVCIFTAFIYAEIGVIDSDNYADKSYDAKLEECIALYADGKLPANFKCLGSKSFVDNQTKRPIHPVKLRIGDTVHVYNTNIVWDSYTLKTESTKFGITYHIEMWNETLELRVKNITATHYEFLPIKSERTSNLYHPTARIDENDVVRLVQDEHYNWLLEYYDNTDGSLLWKGDYKSNRETKDIMFNGYCYKNDVKTRKSIMPSACK